MGDFKYDRLLSKWAVFKEGADVDELVSHARYANVDAIHAKQSVEAVPLKSKKGLGGLINHGLLTHDWMSWESAVLLSIFLLVILCIFLSSRVTYCIHMEENILF